MTPEQREALQKSVEHWDENVRLAELGVQPELGWRLCACCVIWINRPECDGCPISQVTGRPNCERTWYEDIVDASSDETIDVDACILERDWLKLILDSEVDDD